MGLDMRAFARPPEAEGMPEHMKDKLTEDIMYWRKHPNLHGWMENLWKEKGCPGLQEGEKVEWNTFNCIPLQLTMDDINRLAGSLHELPHTTGFFFGESRPEDTECDFEFITKAREYLERGWNVYYDSWW